MNFMMGCQLVENSSHGLLFKMCSSNQTFDIVVVLCLATLRGGTEGVNGAGTIASNKWTTEIPRLSVSELYNVLMVNDIN